MQPFKLFLIFVIVPASCLPDGSCQGEKHLLADLKNRQNTNSHAVRVQLSLSVSKASTNLRVYKILESIIVHTLPGYP